MFCAIINDSTIDIFYKSCALHGFATSLIKNKRVLDDSIGNKHLPPILLLKRRRNVAHTFKWEPDFCLFFFFF
jgi:hypothetical protein